jgi:DNA recombination protein RmuC
MDNSQFYIVLVVLIAGFAAVFYFMRRNSSLPQQDNEALRVMTEWMKEIKQGTDATRDSVQKSIEESSKGMNERLDNAARVIATFTKELGGVSQIGPDIRRLTETLASPKLRGNFGEEMLQNLLSQVLPPSAYEIQHKFKSGDTVDAIIKINGKMLCIDSKFSMENYRLYQQAKENEPADNLKKAFFKDIKNRVAEIHKKYILPQEETFDFALMYIPSEGVYMEVVNDQEIMDASRSKKVFFVGPNTFYMTLQTFLISLKGQQINQAAHKILNMIAGIKQESTRFSDQLRIVGGHIQKSSSAYSTAVQDFGRLQTNIDNASQLELAGETAEEIEKAKTTNNQLIQ